MEQTYMVNWNNSDIAGCLESPPYSFPKYMVDDLARNILTERKIIEYLRYIQTHNVSNTDLISELNEFVDLYLEFWKNGIDYDGFRYDPNEFVRKVDFLISENS